MTDGVDDVDIDRLRRELERELRHRIEEELRPELRRRIEATVRTEAERDVRAAIAAEAPSAGHRAAFLDLSGHVQWDARAQATLASDRADALASRLARTKRVTHPIAALALLALAPTLVELGRTTESAAMRLAIGFSLMLLVTGTIVRSFQRHGRWEREEAALRKTASDYAILAERAHAYRVLQAERRASAAELDGLMADLTARKERLDRDHHPSTAELEAVREAVRPRIEPVLPPLKQRIADEEASGGEFSAQAAETKRRA